MNFLRRNFIVAIICGLTIGVLSLLPMKFFPHVGVSNADKIVHAIMYFGFCSTLLWSMYFNHWRNAAFKGFLIAACYGACMEILQLLTFNYVHRYFEWWDILSNTTGALIAALLVEFLLKKSFIFRVNTQ
jgi:VanZ family protein